MRAGAPAHRTPPGRLSRAAPRTATGGAGALRFLLLQPGISSYTHTQTSTLAHVHRHTRIYTLGSHPTSALTRAYSTQTTHSALRWQNPTCNHLWSQPHSFLRSGFISTLTVIIFYLFNCLKNLVPPFFPSLSLLIRLSFISFLCFFPHLPNLSPVGCQPWTLKFMCCFYVIPKPWKFFSSLSHFQRMIQIEGGVGVKGSDSERDPTLQSFYGYTHQPNHPPLPLRWVSPRRDHCPVGYLFAG